MTPLLVQPFNHLRHPLTSPLTTLAPSLKLWCPLVTAATKGANYARFCDHLKVCLKVVCVCVCVCVCVLHVDVALEFFFMCITSNHASAILQSEGTAEIVSSYHVIDHASVMLHSVETDKIVSSICDISCVNNLIPGGQ